MELDSTTRSPDSFSGLIDIVLGGPVCDKACCCIQKDTLKFSTAKRKCHRRHVITDQHDAHRICIAVMIGTEEEDLQCLEIGPIVHSRLLTLACRILRYYTSFTDAPNKLAILEEFCIIVCFLTWFDIKTNNSITDSPRNFFKLMQRIVKFPHKQVRDISMKAIQRNAYISHQEAVILGILAHENDDLRRVAVNKV